MWICFKGFSYHHIHQDQKQLRKINLDEIFIGWEPHQIQKCSQKLHLILEADALHTCSCPPLQSLAVQAGRHCLFMCSGFSETQPGHMSPGLILTSSQHMEVRGNQTGKLSCSHSSNITQYSYWWFADKLERSLKCSVLGPTENTSMKCTDNTKLERLEKSTGVDCRRILKSWSKGW